MRDTNKQVAIPTLDPRGSGGVQTVAKFTYNTLQESDKDPKLMFNSIDWEESISLKSISKLDIKLKEEGEFDKMEGVRISRILPELETFGYLLNSRIWAKELRNANVIFGVGGTCLPCLPAALHDHRFQCWVGTTLIDERRSQLQMFPPSRKYRYLLEEPLLMQMEKYIYLNCNKIWTQSTYVKRMIKEHYDISDSKFGTLKFPIDTDKFAPSTRTTNNKLITTVGRINDPRKNTKFLLDSFGIVNDKIPESKLRLIGEEPEKELLDYIEQLDIADSIEILGRVPDLVSKLQDSTVFALPSLQEGLGIAGLEAMSCGLPVVSTQCGGPEDYITNGQNGYLVATNDVKGFADHLIEILDNKDLQDRLGTNARETVKKEYNEEYIADKIVSIVN